MDYLFLLGDHVGGAPPDRFSMLKHLGEAVGRINGRDERKRERACIHSLRDLAIRVFRTPRVVE